MEIQLTGNKSDVVKSLIFSMLDVLKEVVFDPWGVNNQFILCLIINKMIMYYQLDLYKEF